MNLKGRSFLKLLDYTPAEIAALLSLAARLKAQKKAGVRHDGLRGKNIALIFEKTSTRTRCSFEVAAHDLGMEVTYLDPAGSQIGKKESIADTARVLGRMFDGIEYRGYGQEIVEELARYAGVPVWNGLTNEFHPTQILIGYLAQVLIGGWAVERSEGRPFWSGLGLAAGVAVSYAFGTAWFIVQMGCTLSYALAVCVAPFIPFDAAKAALASGLGSVLRRTLLRAGLLRRH